MRLLCHNDKWYKYAHTHTHTSMHTHSYIRHWQNDGVTVSTGSLNRPANIHTQAHLQHPSISLTHAHARTRARTSAHTLMHHACLLSAGHRRLRTDLTRRAASRGGDGHSWTDGVRPPITKHRSHTAPRSVIDARSIIYCRRVSWPWQWQVDTTVAQGRMDGPGGSRVLMDAWRGRGFLIPPHITHHTWEGRRNGRHRVKRVPYGRMEGKGVPHPTPHHAPHMGGMTEWTARGEGGSLWTHGGEGGSSSHPTSRTAHGRDDGMDGPGGRGFLMDAWRGRGFLIPPHITHRTWEGWRNGRPGGKGVPYGCMEGKGVPHPTPHHAPHMGGTKEWTARGEGGSLSNPTWEGQRNGQPGG